MSVNMTMAVVMQAAELPLPATDVVGNVVSGAGNAVCGLLNSAGNTIGGVFGNFLSSAGNGISGFADTVGNAISSGVSWLNNNVVQPVINTGIELVQDLVPIATGIASFPLHVVGNAVDGLGDTFGALHQGDFYLRPIYGNSIDYGSIRIQSGGIKESVGIAPQTTGNNIFMRQEWNDKDIFKDDGTLTEDGLHLLGHEAGHVWRSLLGRLLRQTRLETLT